MYIQITTRRYIRNIKLTTNIIKGNCRPQMVTCQKLVFTRVLTFLFLITNLPLTPINTFLHVHQSSISSCTCSIFPLWVLQPRYECGANFQTSNVNQCITFCDYMWVTVTYNDIDGQSYITYVTSGRNLSIHAKNCVPVCCQN